MPPSPAATPLPISLPGAAQHRRPGRDAPPLLPPRSGGAMRRGRASLRPASGGGEAGGARADGGRVEQRHATGDRAEQGRTTARGLARAAPRPRARPRRGAAAEALARRPGAAERAVGERPRVGQRARCGRRVAAAAARSPSERRSASSAALTPLPFLTRSVLTRSVSWRRSTSPTQPALEVSATEQCIYGRWIWLR